MTSTHDEPTQSGVKRFLILLALLAAVALAFGTAVRGPGAHGGDAAPMQAVQRQ